ncbi:MAG: nitroreductase family protein [Aeoliella sp.]
MPYFPTVPYCPQRLSETNTLERARTFYDSMSSRRSVRDFSDDPVPRQLIELAIETASSAPSGANRQPWKFVAVSNQESKHAIRIAAEAEERAFYEGNRSSPEWLEALAPLGTDWRKPFLESAPWLVVVFEETYGLAEDGTKRKNFYVKESVGIACGMFIAALQNMGLATLTHTPSPMDFLANILGRPANEKPYILFPIGYPALNARVPDIERRPLEEVAVWHS